jgi:hypothetical protein
VIVCICGTYVVDSYVVILGFNLGENMVNSDGYWLNE